MAIIINPSEPKISPEPGSVFTAELRRSNRIKEEGKPALYTHKSFGGTNLWTGFIYENSPYIEGDINLDNFSHGVLYRIMVLSKIDRPKTTKSGGKNRLYIGVPFRRELSIHGHGPHTVEENFSLVSRANFRRMRKCIRSYIEIKSDDEMITKDYNSLRTLFSNNRDVFNLSLDEIIESFGEEAQ